MIIDRILDRYDGDAYDPKEFYDAMMSYEEGTDYKISRAMDSGEEEDIRRELCAYIDDAQYNPKIKDFINSVAWLEPDNGKKYKAEIDILGESKKSEKAPYEVWKITCDSKDAAEKEARLLNTFYKSIKPYVRGDSIFVKSTPYSRTNDIIRKRYHVQARLLSMDDTDYADIFKKGEPTLSKSSMQKKKESLGKKNESSFDELRVPDGDVAIVIHDIDRFDGRFEDSMLPGDGEEFTLPEFRRLIGDLAETSNGFASVSRDGANIRAAIEVPQENDEGELTDQYKEELVLYGTARIHDNSLDRVADYLNDYLDHR